MKNKGWKHALVIGLVAASALLMTAPSSFAQSPGARPTVTQQQGLDLVRPSTEDQTFGRAPPSQFGGPRVDQWPDSCWIAREDEARGYWGSCSEPRARRRDNRSY
jgi:hypothetical protein